jgi:antitoxin ParD1/3/4
LKRRFRLLIENFQFCLQPENGGMLPTAGEFLAFWQSLPYLLLLTEAPMGTMNISLPDPMKNWVEEQSRTGRYANSSDYVRDLIRRDRARSEAIAELQAAINTGLASGLVDEFDRSDFKARMRAKYDRN